TDKDPAEFRMVPASSELRLHAGFRNGGFEKGKIAWVGAGDARILPSFGAYTPTVGTKMGVVSTGLGFTDTSGDFSQTFCIPENTKKLSVDWNYLSAEFMTYCTSQYQDVFAVTITDADGNETKLFEKTVDALCGSVGPAGAEIPQSGDPDGTFTTGWLPAQ